MRLFICFLAIVTPMLMAGCGQTGALQLPSDPNYDKRSQYLIYNNAEQKKLSKDQTQKSDAQIEVNTDQSVQPKTP